SRGRRSPSMAQGLILLLGPRGQPRRCMPATNTWVHPRRSYCLQMGARHASTLCHRCDASDPPGHHHKRLLPHRLPQPGGEHLVAKPVHGLGIQHPNSVNITLHLGKCRGEPFSHQPPEELCHLQAQRAFCTDEFSDISPLSGGNVAFSTLEGRPSAYNFDGSPALQVLISHRPSSVC
uniref:Uncharacterized protein n=1 Tax=Melopsittacus undulatus TaxID=13146 RepID=A0A8V5GTW2_MELUD